MKWLSCRLDLWRPRKQDLLGAEARASSSSIQTHGCAPSTLHVVEMLRSSFALRTSGG
jgi:hypothetical protein